MRKKVFSNFIWRFLERVGAQGVTLIVSIVLARILDPELYGTIALVTVFISILQVFIDSGMGLALVQKKDSDDVDFSSVFFFNVLMCGLLYVLMFFSAPLIAKFYGMPELTAVIRVLSLTLIISGVKNIQQAYVAKNLLFRKFFFSTLGGTIGAAVVGIAMALNGYGIWALVAQHLFNMAVDTAILWITVKWRPRLLFSFERLKKLLRYGWKLMVSALLDRGYNELRQLIIGKKYSAADLAYYDKGDQFPKAIATNTNTSIESVLFPVLADEQEDTSRVRDMTRTTIRLSTYILAPLMIGLAACADPLVRVVLTEKWIQCVPFLRVFCIIYMFQPIHTSNLNAIKAVGRSDIFLLLEIIKKSIGVAVLLATLWFGPLVMAYSLLATSLINQVVNSWPNKKLLEYSYLEQVKDILPSLLLASFMGVVVFCFQFLPIAPWIILLIQIPAGIVVYLAGSLLLKNEMMAYIIRIIKGLKKKNSDTIQNTAAQD